MRPTIENYCERYAIRLSGLTSFDRAVDVILGLVVYPVKAGLHRHLGQEPVLVGVSVRGGDVHGSALVVEGVGGVVSVLVPGLRHPEAHTGPLVHHSYGQLVQTVLRALREMGKRETEGDTEKYSCKSFFFCFFKGQCLLLIRELRLSHYGHTLVCLCTWVCAHTPGCLYYF